MEPNILLTRIDNRLVHGQVGVIWTKTLGANLIVVVDDEAAENALQQKLMEAIAHSSGAEIRFFTLQHTADVIYDALPEQRIFFVIKDLATARRMVELHIPVKEINLGNLHFERGKKPFNRKVYLGLQDIEDLRYLISKEVNVYFQDVPGDGIEHFKERDLQRLSEN